MGGRGIQLAREGGRKGHTKQMTVSNGMTKKSKGPNNGRDIKLRAFIGRKGAVLLSKGKNWDKL